MSEFEEVKLDKLRKEANLREVDLPACCLSCDHHEDAYEDTDWCDVLDMRLDSPFAICNHYEA
jgi:hypothetical protein